MRSDNVLARRWKRAGNHAGSARKRAGNNADLARRTGAGAPRPPIGMRKNRTGEVPIAVPVPYISPVCRLPIFQPLLKYMRINIGMGA